MSKIPLATKYRPKSFEDLTEQFSISEILTYQVNTNTNKNSYLFTGPAGCGKTTSARIFGSMLNGGVKNLIELDGASNNSVDDVRAIIEEAKFQDLSANYKIYIIDECHMLSIGAWNALLKLLEEPPLKTVFILCTTDAQKIPKTILSRVQRFDFKKISYEGIIKRLIYILTEEQASGEDITYHPEALEYIARISEGGMRDAITLLDKCLSYSKELTLDNITKALDITDMSVMTNLTTNLFNRNINEIISITEKIYQDGFDIKLFCKQYLTYIVNCIKYYSTKDAKLTNLPNNIIKLLDSLQYNSNFYIALMDALVKLNEMIKWETSPKTLFQAYLISFIKG